MPAPRSHRATGLEYAAFVTCCLIWGSTFLFIRVGNESLPPLFSAALRMALASVILAALMVVTRAPWPKGKALWWAAGFGLLDFALSLSLLYWGEQYVSSGLSAVIYATCPLTVALFAIAAKLERPKLYKLVGAVVGFAGVAIIFAGQGGGQSPAGILAVFAAATVGSLGAIYFQLGPPQRALSCNAVAMPFGALGCWAGSLAVGERQALPTTWPTWMPVLYLATAGSVVAFTTFTWLLIRWKSSSAAMIAVVIPVIAVALGAAVRGEVLPPLGAAGAIVVVATVAITLYLERRDEAIEVSSPATEISL